MHNPRTLPRSVRAWRGAMVRSLPASSLSVSRGTALREIAFVFLKLGAIGFGGPAAHIAMMEDEVVTRRQWLTRERFLDLLGATNLIPGPNSTEMAIHLGYLRAGWAGLMLAGACFILPAVMVTGAFAWLYVKYGTVPEAARFLGGVKPAVLAIIVGAVWRLGRTAFRGWPVATIGALVLAASLLGVDEILALFGGGVLGAVLLRATRRNSNGKNAAKPQSGGGVPAILAPIPLLPNAVPLAALTAGATGVATVSLWKLGLFFLKVGAVLYGSGYVLVAFLEGGLVQEYGWLTEQQLLDAIAVGQFTPGPVLSTATFIGYLLAGWPGAAVATAAIFAPSFLFVALLGQALPRMRQWNWAGAFLDAVNASSVALMAAVAIELMPVSVATWPAALIAVLVLAASLFARMNAAWLVAGAAAVGWWLL
jgi:chromate transporter